MNIWLYLAPVLGCAALLFAFFTAKRIDKISSGTPRMQQIAAAISDGARAFLNAQYKILAVFAAAVFLGIGFGLRNWITAVCFLVGAGFSVLAGNIGMRVATKANVRTANAARTGGMTLALRLPRVYPVYLQYFRLLYNRVGSSREDIMRDIERHDCFLKRCCERFYIPGGSGWAGYPAVKLNVAKMGESFPLLIDRNPDFTGEGGN